MVSLLLLTLMSLLGLGAMQAAQLEEKMASNFRYGVAAFYAAEAGLQQAIVNHTNNQISSSITGTLEQSSFSASVTESAGIYTISSEGSHSNSGSRQQLTMVLSGAAGAAPTIDSWSQDE